VFRLPILSLTWPKIFPRAGVYPNFRFGRRGFVTRMGRRRGSVHAGPGIIKAMLAGIRGGADGLREKGAGLKQQRYAWRRGFYLVRSLRQPDWRDQVSVIEMASEPGKGEGPSAFHGEQRTNGSFGLAVLRDS